MRFSSARFTSTLAIGLALSVFLPASAASAAGAPAQRYATSLELSATGDDGAARVEMSFTSTPTYTARLDIKRRRLIVDVPGTAVKGAKSAITKPAGVVGGVMTQTFNTPAGKTTRLMVTLLKDASYAVRVEGDKLVLDFEPGPLGVMQKKRIRKRAAAPAEGITGVARVSDVRFEHSASEDKVIVELSESTQYSQERTSTGRIRLLLSSASLPAALTRTLDTTAFGGRVKAISSYVLDKKKQQVVIEVDAEKSEARLQRRGNSLVWSFYEPGSLPSTVTGVGRDGGIARKTRTVHVETDYADVPKVHDGFPAGVAEKVAQADEAAGVSNAVLGQRRGFTGRRIDLDLKDADIHNVLRLIADVGRVNIVTADNVSGTVTIRMRNVPWDQALDIVLQAKSLGMVRQGNMIRVAPLADLEKEREMAIARRKQEMQLAPIETRLIPVSYANAGDIQARAKDLLSERGSIAVDERTNVMIVRDVAGNLNQIEELTRSLDTQTPQVLVEARIVEATSRYLRDVGIQWGGDATFSSATGNPTGLVFPNSVGVVGGASDTNTPTAGLSPFSNTVQNPNFAVNLPATVGTGQGGAIGLSFGSIDNTINLAVRLSAAESSGMLRILSSPRILTLDNHEARISQGTLIPFSQISAQGVQTTFQEAKLQLLVRPHVTADGSVSMKVKINRDEPDFNQTSARGDPTILKREAETNLLVMDGHTAVIGGIFTRNTGRNLDQVPFFGDIPLIGLLFQRRRASDSRGELVIFLTPRIVNRAEALGR